MNFRRVIICVMSVVIIAFISTAALPYIQVHTLTKKYGDQFKNRYAENGFYENIACYKVLRYKNEKAWFYCSGTAITDEMKALDDNCAAVLYVEEGHSTCSVYVFEESDAGWKFKTWYTVWSSSGSADLDLY